MATFNHSHSNTTNLLSSSSISSISAISQHYERNTTATTTAFLLPSVAGAGGGGGGGAVTTSTAIVAPAPTQTAHSVAPTAVTPLHLDSFVTGAPPPPHFLAAQHHQHHQQHHHTANSSTSSYTLVQIKREPCQVSEVTSATNNSHHHQHHHHQHQQHQLSSSASASMSTQQSITGCSASSSSSSALAATSKTMAALSATTSSTSSTLTTLVKLEPPSPKVHEMDKSSSATAALTATTTNTNSTVPIGIAVARKRPQESNASATLGPASASLPMQQTLNKDLNCFGIRVADLGGVSNGCGSFYFTGNGDLMTGSTTAEEFALSAAAQSVNRAPSTFWQYPNTLPIESVISMSPATVGLQYSREASRGVVLLPATATALDPFQQAAAAFVWPSYIPQNTAPAALQPPPNFIFPSMSSHSTLQAAPSYATPLQLFGSNYLAAAAAAAAATSTLCQHSQQQTTISAASANGLGRFMNTTTSTSTDLQKSSLLTAASTSGSASMATSSSTTKHITNTGITTMSLAGSHNPMGGLQPLPPPPTATTSLILPPNAMKLEDWSPDFMALAKHTAGGSLHPLGAAPPAHTNTSTSSLIVPAGAASLSGSLLGAAGHPSGLLDLGPSPGGALNLIRLPTPPSSATMESAAAAAVTPQMPQHLLFHPATSTASPTASASATPATALLNLTVTTTPSPATARLTNGTPTNPNCFVGGAAGSVAPSIGPPTPLAEELAPMNFKTDLAGQQFGFGVPRDVAGQQQHVAPANGVLPPQMQDVNIQTDTPVCSEDENSSCPLAIQQQQQQQLQPANGDVTSTSHSQTCNSHQTSSVDAGELTGHKDREDDQQPLELTKTNEGGKANGSVQTDSVVGPVGAPECHRREEDKTNHAAGLSETGPLPKENNNYKKAQPVGEADPGLPPMPTLSSASSNSLPVTNNNINSNTSDSRATPAQPNSAEEMTGLELLSNISTSTLVKTVQSSGNMPLMRIKQEPVDHSEIAHPPVTPRMVHEDELHHQQPEVSAPTPPQPPPPAVEAFGGLNLLCALAEQRIQEEVQTSGLFDATGGSTPTPTPCNTSLIKMNNDEEEASPLARSFSGFPLVVAQSAGAPPTAYRREHSAFPSMESIELPSTSGAGLAGSAGSAAGANGLMPEPVKRKKHKHSKSSKSAASYSLVAAVAAGGCPTPTKKSQRCSKKSKKKCAKEKHHKHSHKEAAASDLDLNDEALQEDLKNAFNSVDPMYAQRFGKLPDPHEIINMVETSMRLRLADVTRQYRKKKRKLDEISKNKLAKKKRKKCSKLAAAAVAGAVATEQAINGAPASAATGLTLTGGVAGGPASSFPAFANSAVAVTSPYLHNNTFLRFGDKSTNILARTQFPPPPTPSLLAASGGGLSESGATAGEPGSDPMPTPLPAYKPVRLEPSALAAAEQSRAAGGNASSSSVMRLAAKHPSSEKLGGSTTPAKERKLNSSSSGGGRSRHSSGPEVSTPAPQPPPKKPNPMDRELILTSEHLYRSETRVLTDMGGLFYAGIMKPLQPPDIYAITLDGERGNKSHIMSREEIFKDTILEVTPKSVDSVPVGTRLCAYWSQQYRCLYPGRAIESETSEDDDTTAPKDFVSVEFDDGDSGRIRLQNIRLLLSDFPIVEYNENPLSTLGKQKKASLGAGAFRSAADPPSLGGQSLDTQHQQQQQFLAQPPAQMGAFSDLQQQQQEQQNAREVYAAKRIERKRKKSLKKKSQQASASASLSPCAAQPADDLTCTLLASSSGTTMNGSDTAATTRTVVAATGAGGSTAGPAGVGESSDCGRKHHKHKKRKKHKKQRHHRKALDSLEGSDECYAVIRSSVGGLPLPPATPFVGKQELDDMDGDGDEDDEDEEEEDEEEVAADQLNGNASRATSVGRHTAFGGAGAAAAAAAAAVDNPMFGKKTYTNGTSAAAAIKMEPTNGVRVKTEHIDYEEETASNLMSEVSDEVKGDDEIEHNNSKGSKIAAFLPDRQLWGWLGKAYRKAGVKGRARKQFYKTIKRGKEKITVGDCAVFLSTGRPDRPYIGRIESMWETSSSNKVVRVRWFYHPEETTGCPDLKYPGALFESPHEDENDVQTISHHCEVLPFERYFGKFGSDSKQYQSIYDNNDTYYLAGYYNPRLKALKLQNDIPTLEEDNTAAANTSSTQNTAIAATQPTAQSAGMAATNTTATTISANTNRQD